MAFESCNYMDAMIGYALVALAFIMSIMQIDAHGKLSESDKSNNSTQYTLAILVLVLCILYTLYAFREPIMAVLGQANDKVNSMRKR